MKNYLMIRGPVAEARCKNKSEYGSPLYCDCDCQTPRDTDPDINLDGVTVSRKDDEGYANYVLTRNGEDVGIINVQHSYIYIDGHEFLGVDKDYIGYLLAAARNILTVVDNQAGDTLEETAAAVKMAEIAELADMDARNAHHPGYCTKCHSYCYGDCDAN
jgi:hypothetical protein